MRTRLAVTAAAGCLILLAAGILTGLARAQRPKILEEIELPPPQREGGMSLTRALQLRRSVRSYAPHQPLTLDQIGQLFWAAQGLNRPEKRTAPSAGALYPLEIYAATRKGIYHYRPHGHKALAAWQGGLIDSLFVAAGSKNAIRKAPAVFVITGILGRTESKYGRRAERYVSLEAGHAAQNLLLQATALGLNAVPIGAYEDAKLRRVLDLPAEQTPYYLIPVGYPPEH